MEQRPTEPFRVTRTMTLTNSSFDIAETFWESQALPEALAAAVGVIAQEWESALSVPETSALGFVDTMIVTKLNECVRLGCTLAEHDKTLDEALACEVGKMERPTAETTTALRARPTFDTRSACACFIALTVMAITNGRTSFRRFAVHPDRWWQVRQVFRTSAYEDSRILAVME